MQEIHSGLSEYICVLDGKDKAVDGNKMEFYFCERNNGQGCLGTNYLKPKRGWEHSKNFSFDFVHCMERMPIFVTVGMSILAQYMTTILLIY